ncbi:calcineurin-like phosphoesterase C-terminal domain-containing protein [Echinicola salinicaeni]|uniref:calcineurin-like phosphoesterase C-terminal domain-containing protein n=1 Tax=Echinicola salinicaeni TaxID=2762757 RepID=UPI001644101E|nr:calcineurin-like phosphoesterase C-terminal domain-containing protein [Echinicola salinicaeni]
MKRYFFAFLLMFGQKLSVSAQEIDQLEGYVYNDENRNQLKDLGEKGIRNVLVSNGRDIVSTDEKGHYTINAIGKEPVFIIKPSGFISPLSEDNRVLSFVLSDQWEAKDRKVNFPLNAHEEEGKVRMAWLGDPQVDIIDDVYHVGRLVTEELMANPPDFIIPLGDLSFDNLEIFKPLAETIGKVGVPVFYTIGNHDLNFGGKALDERDDAFNAYFGPSYYAFEYGEELFIVLNNIYPIEGRKYEGRVDEKQMTFLRNLLRHYSGKKSVHVAMHIPLEEVVNRAELLSLFDGFEDVFFAVGHTHTQYHRYFDRADLPAIHELVGGAVCGAWWQGPHDFQGTPWAIMYDGTPKGYWIMEKNNDDRKLSYKVSGAASSTQMNIWTPQNYEWDTLLNELNEPFIYANVFGAAPETVVKVSFDDGGTWQLMESYSGVDPFFQRMIFNQKAGRYSSLPISKIPDVQRKSQHLWRWPIPEDLPQGVHKLIIKANDERFGFSAKAYKLLWR